MGFQSCFELEKYWSLLDLIFNFKQARKTGVSELYVKQLQSMKFTFPAWWTDGVLLCVIIPKDAGD